MKIRILTIPIAAFIFILEVQSVNANHGFNIDSSYNEKSVSESFTYRGSSRPNRWTIGLTHLKTTASDSISGASYTDNTFDLNGGYGYRNIWNALVGFHIASTPNEKLTEYGPQFILGRDWDLSLPKSEGDFTPTLYLEGVFSMDHFKQNFSTTTVTRRRTAIRKANNQIVQFGLGVNTTYSPYEWTSIDFGYQRTFFSRNVSNFISSLDNSNSIAKRTSNFSSTLSSFVDHTFQTTLNFYISNAFEIYSRAGLFRGAADKKWEKSLKLGGSYEFFQKLSLGASYQYDFNIASAPHTYSASLGARF